MFPLNQSPPSFVSCAIGCLQLRRLRLCASPGSCVFVCRARTCSPLIGSSLCSSVCGMQLTCGERNTPTVQVCQHAHTHAHALTHAQLAHLLRGKVRLPAHIEAQERKYIYTSHGECCPSANRRGESLPASVSHMEVLAKSAGKHMSR